MKNTKLALILCSMVTTGFASYAGGSAGASGPILTTASGMTLYTFDKDSDGQSNCYDVCAAKWPPYLTTDGDAPSAAASSSTRKDGSEQWVVNNQPLYGWVGDRNPGDTTGDGVGGVWHTATAGGRVATKSGAGY